MRHQTVDQTSGQVLHPDNEMDLLRDDAVLNWAQVIRQNLLSENAAAAVNAAHSAVASLDRPAGSPALAPCAAARLLNLCASAWMLNGELSLAVKALIRALDAADLAADKPLRTLVAVNLGLLGGLCGQFRAAREACASGRAALASMRMPEALAQLNNIAWLWMWEADAAQMAGEAAAAAEALLNAQEAAQQFVGEATANAGTGVDGTDAVPNDTPAARADLMAGLLLRLGQVPQARASFESALSGQPLKRRQRPSLLVAEAEVALAEQRAAAALALVQASPASSGFGTSHTAGVEWIATGARLQLRRLDVLARAHALLGQTHEAAQALEQHVRLLRQHTTEQLRALPMLTGLVTWQAQHRHENLTYMVHDVRAPLGHIIAALRDRDLPDKVEVARTVAEKTLTRIDALMQYLRLDNATAVQRQPLDLGSVVDDACEELALRASESGQQLVREIVFDANLTVHGHRDSLLRATVNLLDNALKATPAHGRVVMRCGREGSNVVLCVSDQGSGMPDSVRTVLCAGPGSLHENASPFLASGFGLRYVARVASMHEARVEVRVSEKGGSVALVLKVYPNSESG